LDISFLQSRKGRLRGFEFGPGSFTLGIGFSLEEHGLGVLDAITGHQKRLGGPRSLGVRLVMGMGHGNDGDKT